ncbi:SusC/RagA family TonB-linked outer membrane protein [Flavobacterium sp. U410]
MRNSNYCLKQVSKRERYFFLLFLFFSFSALTAQNIKVSGVVSDKQGLTLPGVNVVLKGTQKGVITDFDGNYELEVPANGVLNFSYIGFKTLEVSVNSKTTLNVTLEENVSSLEEIVVIGYGSQKKGEVNSSISSVNMNNVREQPKTTVEQLLQGQAAGVTVTSDSGKPGAAVSVKIRGAASLTGSNEPLYVIDGIPISGDATFKAMGGQPIAGENFTNQGDNTVSPLAALNPNDIESIDILKDASATAIYGSRGANGVVIITTKSGKKGEGKISYDTYVSLQKQYKLLDVMNLQQYAVQQNALAEVYGMVPRVEFQNPELLGSGTNWQDEIYKTGMIVSHQLAFSGGKEDTSYYLSGGYMNQEGTVIGSGFKRYSFKANLDNRVKKWLKVGGNITGAITNEDLTLNSSNNGIINLSLLSAPDLPVTTSDGQFATQQSNNSGVFYRNPVGTALGISNNLIRKNFMGNLYADADIIKGLKYRFEFGANTEFSENNIYTPEATYLNTSKSILHVRRQNWYAWNLKNYLTYDFRLGENHKFTVLAGQESSESVWEGVLNWGYGFLNDQIQNLNVADADQTQASSYKGSSALSSYFGRILYDFNNKYGITATYRADGSSKFAEGNRWGYFPGISGSWRVSNESFMENTKKYVDDIKIRVGYGETGNQNIPNYLYGSTLYSFQTSTGTGFTLANIPNPKLKWETSRQTNIGLDFSVFDKTLKFSIDHYKKVTDDLLYQVPLPDYYTGGYAYEGGTSAQYSNVGKVSNTGWDFAITYTNKALNGFSWTSNLVISKYKNKLESVSEELDLSKTIYLNDYTESIVTNSTVGQPLGLFYGLESAGIFRTQEDLNGVGTYFGQTPQLGDVKYVDQNGDGKIDEKDMTYIGNPHPDFTFGFTNNFEYKGFTLSLFFQGSYGNDIMNLTRKAGTSNTYMYTNQLAEASDFWTPDNVDASLPRPVSSLSHANNRISSRFVEDGSYIRLQNLTMGYNFPKEMLSKMKMSRLKIYMGVQNLFTITNYKGYDPEVGSFNQDVLLMGIDNGRYPNPRTYTMGLNVEF